MAFTSSDGRKFTNRPPMKAHEAFLARTAKMRDPLQAPGSGDEGDELGEMEPHHAAIHDHLQAMHAETGESHSHIEHHGDGSHSSHHIDVSGEVRGPYRHASTEDLLEHMRKHLPDEADDVESDNDEAEDE